jgi:hypothetical protein
MQDVVAPTPHTCLSKLPGITDIAPMQQHGHFKKDRIEVENKAE